MESKKFSSMFKPYSSNFLFSFDCFRGLQSVVQEDYTYMSVNKIIDQESEKRTTSTNQTKSSNFSQDSIMKSLMQLSQLSTNHLKEIKDSLTSKLIRTDCHRAKTTKS